MKRTTIFADEALLSELKDLAKEEQRSVAEMIRDVLQRYVQQRKQRRKRLSFLGVGASGRSDIAERHEQLLWKRPRR